MFGKSKANLNIMHYNGLPGWGQDKPAFLNITEKALTFSTKSGERIELLRDKITEVDVLPEHNYMLKYQNSNTTTSHLGTKWYGVIAYLSDGKPGKIAFWYTSPKVSKALYNVTPKNGGDVSL